VTSRSTIPPACSFVSSANYSSAETPAHPPNICSVLCAPSSRSHISSAKGTRYSHRHSLPCDETENMVALRIRNRCHVKNRRLLFKSFSPHQPPQLQPQIRPRLHQRPPVLHTVGLRANVQRQTPCSGVSAHSNWNLSARFCGSCCNNSRNRASSSSSIASSSASSSVAPASSITRTLSTKRPTAGTFPSAIRWAASRESALSRPHPPQLPPESLRRVHLEPHQQILCMSHLNSSTSSPSGADFPSRANPLILSFRTESAE
jgi:hypothetical protein